MTQGTAEAITSTYREILAARIFDAPRDLVFQMWTDPKHIGNWWGPKGFSTTIHEMNVRPGGVWRFIMHGPDGKDYQNKIVYREVVKPERLVYDHVSGPLFQMTVTFAERAGKTMVSARMVFESAALRNKVAAEFHAVEGLNQTLDRLGEELINLPNPSEQNFVISRVFDAPRDVVWKALTEPDRLMQWWGPKGFTMKVSNVDLRPGGLFHYGMQAPNGSEMWGKWVYSEIVPPEKLVFVNSFSDQAGNTIRAPFSATWPLEILNTITFEEHAGRTTLTLRGGPINATEEERKTFQGARSSMQQGFTGTFDQLEAYLAKA